MINSGQVVNFGGNVRFRPRHVDAPKNEAELLTILNEHRRGKVRAAGSKHAWSPGIRTGDALVDLRHFNSIRIHEVDGQPCVTVGGGCQVKTLLVALNERQLTLPSIGLITEQTLAGATSTGTHGSGKHSLSHYIQSLRIACFDTSGDAAQIVDVTGGVELQAARCAIGCLGVIVQLTLPCIPQYYVEEKWQPCEAIEEALALEADTALQQFFLLPYAWSYVVQRRRVAERLRRSGTAALYRLYCFATLDVGMHLLVKLFASILKSRRLVHLLFRRIMPMCVFPPWVVVDRSDRQLVMEHQLFRHLECEIFVRRSQVVDASRYVVDVLRLADDRARALTADHQRRLVATGLAERVESLRGTFTHHYPVCYRRILPDDTLISMAAGEGEDWYAISLITYVRSREPFYQLAAVLAESMHELFAARVHWGKWFPFNAQQVSEQYPRLAEFRQVCRRFDPHGVFCNQFVQDKLGIGELSNGQSTYTQ